ncbi:hypothetical protein lbkm_3721 [Lachnospiraceae bacterium KM106-2]|nr:hypothetical protein lbkm_3721 [Lachnospiraceae bacterium KM106-2]
MCIGYEEIGDLGRTRSILLGALAAGTKSFFVVHGRGMKE